MNQFYLPLKFIDKFKFNKKLFHQNQHGNLWDGLTQPQTIMFNYHVRKKARNWFHSVSCYGYEYLTTFFLHRTLCKLRNPLPRFWGLAKNSHAIYQTDKKALTDLVGK